MNANSINALRAALPVLPPRDRDFAASLLAQYDRKGSLSDRQWPYVEKLAAAAQPKPEPKPAETVDLTKLLALFERAAESLQRPKIAFSCSAGDFNVTRAADNSRNPGHLYVKSTGGDYLGKVDPKGAFHAAGWAADEYGDVFEALKGFAEDPAGSAAAYGKATGNCCFCARGLTDSRSVDVGYGPICADRYGLPWGE